MRNNTGRRGSSFPGVYCMQNHWFSEWFKRTTQTVYYIQNGIANIETVNFTAEDKACGIYAILLILRRAMMRDWGV